MRAVFQVLTVAIWNDLHPIDGCSLTRYAIAAHTLQEVSQSTAVIPYAQNRSPTKLRKRANVRASTDGQPGAAWEHPGVVFWEDDSSTPPTWRPVSNPRPVPITHGRTRHPSARKAGKHPR